MEFLVNSSLLKTQRCQNCCNWPEKRDILQTRALIIVKYHLILNKCIFPVYKIFNPQVPIGLSELTLAFKCCAFKTWIYKFCLYPWKKERKCFLYVFYSQRYCPLTISTWKKSFCSSKLDNWIDLNTVYMYMHGLLTAIKIECGPNTYHYGRFWIILFRNYLDLGSKNFWIVLWFLKINSV